VEKHTGGETMSEVDAQRANYRYLDKRGRDVVLTNYTEGGEDAYGDATLTATTSTIKAIKKQYKGSFERDASGGIPVGDAVFEMKDTVEIYDGATHQASKLAIDGDSFTVVMADNQGTGLLAVLTEKKRP